MRTYTLPEPTEIELDLLRSISGSVQSLAAWKKFPSGEIFVRVSGVEERVCLIGRTAPPADNFFRTVLLADTLRRSGAKEVVLLLPYFAYARQDRQTQAGDPVTAASISRILAAVGVDRIVTTDLHSQRNIESSPIPIESVSVIPDMAGELAGDLKDSEFSVVSADYGGQERADRFARALGRKNGAVWIEKDRDEAGTVKARRLVGRLTGDTAVLVDDILDTGGTINEAVRLLKEHGCRSFYLCVVHPVFSAPAVNLVKKLKFKRILISNTFPAPKEVMRMRNIRVVNAAERLASAVS